MRPEIDAVFKTQLIEKVNAFRVKRRKDDRIKADCLDVCLIIDQSVYSQPFRTSQDLVDGLEEFFQTDMRSTQVRFLGKNLYKSINSHPLVKQLRKVCGANITDALMRESQTRFDALMHYDVTEMVVVMEENADLREELNQQTHVLEQQQADIVSKDAIIERISDENTSLRTGLRQARDRIQGLERQVYQLENVRIPELNTEIAQLTDKNEQLSTKVSNLENKNDKLTAQVALLQRSFDRMQQGSGKKSSGNRCKG